MPHIPDRDPLETNVKYTWPSALPTLSAMTFHPAIAGLLTIIELPIQQAERTIKPGEDSDRGREAARAFEENLDNLVWTDGTVSDEQPFSEVLSHALLALVFGHSLDEHVWNTKGNEVRLARLVPIMPETIHEFIGHPTVGGVLVGVTQNSVNVDPYAENRTPEPIPATKLSHYIYKRRGGSFVGTSLLRPMLGPWTYLKMAEKVAAISIERNQMGVPFVWCPDPSKTTTPLTSDDVKNIDKALELLRAGEKTGLRLPGGYKLEFAVPGLADSTKYLEYWNRQIAMAAVQTVLTAGIDGGGSYALSSTQDNVSTRMVTGIAKLVQNTFNSSVARQWHKYRYGDSRFTWPAPRLEFGPVTVPPIEVISKVLNELATSGYADPNDPAMKEWVAKKIGYPIPKPSKPAVIVSPTPPPPE